MAAVMQRCRMWISVGDGAGGRLLGIGRGQIKSTAPRAMAVKPAGTYNVKLAFFLHAYSGGSGAAGDTLQLPCSYTQRATGMMAPAGLSKTSPMPRMNTADVSHSREGAGP
jgi:hypothetical protein